MPTTTKRKSGDENEPTTTSKRIFLRKGSGSGSSGPLSQRNVIDSIAGEEVEKKFEKAAVKTVAAASTTVAAKPSTSKNSTVKVAVTTRSKSLSAKSASVSKSTKSKAATSSSKLSAAAEKQNAEILKLQQENEEMKIQQTTMLSEFSAEMSQHKKLQKDFQTLQCEMEEMKVKHEQSMLKAQAQADMVPALQAEVEDLKNSVQEEKAKVLSLEESLHKAEEVRREMHNTIQDLKGNIRVFCRVRPVLPNEQEMLDRVASEANQLALTSSSKKAPRKSLTISNRRNSLTSPTPASSSSSSSVPVGISVNVHSDAEQRRMNIMQGEGATPQEFVFDRVFAPTESQEKVFNQMGDLVQSVLDGFNVCIFAYGQTGSGKTWTMEGSGDHENNYGVIQRSMDKLFQVQEKMAAYGWKFENNASQLEIYNESINDLLAQDSSGRSIVRSFNKDSIKHVGTAETNIKDLSIHNVSEVSDVLQLLSLAQSSRSVASTKMNEKSSRSHSVFMLRATASHEKSGQIRSGKLVLIDLAGSERIDQSGVTGEQLKEAQAINKSLSSLSNVIQALSKKQKHVPFRDSTLTYLLQNCLGGDSKCLMMVNVSPLMNHANETISSLRFAQKVNACVVGVAKKQGENTKK